MHVLVCDDDSATRYIVCRILTQHFGCRTTECGNGVEALDLIARHQFAFVFLDVEMPLMSGIEVLELLRENEDTRTLPVVILSNVRDEAAVKRLLTLGVSDYVLKPPRADKLVTKLQRLVTALPKGPRHEAATEDAGSILLSKVRPAMLVDGNLDYRFFFVNQAGTFGTIQEAESGAAAIARFRDSPAQIVFIGSELGVVNAEALAKRLRQLRPDGPLRLIGLVDEDVSPARTRVFDDVMPRTLVAEAFRASIRPFVDIPGPFSSVLDVVPELLALTSSAATQVFGMMFDTEVRPRDSAAGLVAAARADVAIVVDDRFVITVGVHMDAPAATAVAVKMFGATEISDDDRASVAAELSNLVAGRIHAHLRDRGLASVPRLPVSHPPGPVQPLPAAEGVTSPFGIEGTGDFVISLLVTDRDADRTQHHDAVTQPGSASPTGPADTAPEAGSPGTGENALPAEAHTGSPAAVA